MAPIRIRLGPFAFTARWEERAAPRTCDAFRRLLPYRDRIIQARWSGEAGFIPLGDLDLGVGAENATSEPAPGSLLFHPAGVSETEILFPYGLTRFASKHGRLAGNHFLTIEEGRAELAEVGRLLCWSGAQDITFQM